mmetsp:Transcript_8775/g.25895  ORF Transcript_8775/g.25895 Transcript_8775/m.25895 type:complete len:234 (-) Transcript_8775:1093-1794(-)
MERFEPKAQSWPRAPTAKEETPAATTCTGSQPRRSSTVSTRLRSICFAATTGSTPSWPCRGTPKERTRRAPGCAPWGSTLAQMPRCLVPDHGLSDSPMSMLISPGIDISSGAFSSVRPKVEDRLPPAVSDMCLAASAPCMPVWLSVCRSVPPRKGWPGPPVFLGSEIAGCSMSLTDLMLPLATARSSGAAESWPFLRMRRSFRRLSARVCRQRMAFRFEKAWDRAPACFRRPP